MKKILCLIAAMLLVATAAQAKDISAGTVEVSGAATLGYNSTDIEVKDGITTDQSSWGLNLNSSYYVVPNLGVGLLLEYDSNTIADIDSSELGIGPIATYSFSMNEQVSLPIFAAITYNSMTGDLADDPSGWGWVIGAGVKYFMADNISLNGIVDYGTVYWETDKTKIEFDQKGFNVFGGLSVYFGGM